MPPTLELEIEFQSQLGQISMGRASVQTERALHRACVSGKFYWVVYNFNKLEVTHSISGLLAQDHEIVR
jgi:hypothetical protein